MKNRLLCLLSFFLIFTFIACASTTLTQVWKNPDLQAGTIKKMMVVGVAKEPAKRQFFEDELAKSLSAHGVSTIKSYTVMTLDELKDKQSAAEKIRSLGVDAVLATRLIDKKVIQVYNPPTYYTYNVPATPYGLWGGYYDSEEVAKLETNIYDVKTAKVIWSALSDSWIDSGTVQNYVFLDFIGVVVDRMTKDGIIPAIEKK